LNGTSRKGNLDISDLGHGELREKEKGRPTSTKIREAVYAPNAVDRTTKEKKKSLRTCDINHTTLLKKTRRLSKKKGRTQHEQTSSAILENGFGGLCTRCQKTADNFDG